MQVVHFNGYLLTQGHHTNHVRIVPQRKQVMCGSGDLDSIWDKGTPMKKSHHLSTRDIMAELMEEMSL